MVRPSSFCDVSLRLPPPAAFLFWASVLATASGHALPRQTKTVALRELDVVAWPPQPTEAPAVPLDFLFPRQGSGAANTVCGYIDGDLALPATCGAGSHCVLELGAGAVGCCPDAGPCSTGVFTGCVDGNSDPQTEANPYVFTCGSGDVCFRNQYAGGYFQWGCGTASDQGTTVQTSAAGATASLDLPASSVGLTQTPSSLSAPTTIGSASRTRTGSSSTTTDSSASSTSTSTQSSSATTTSSSSSSESASSTSSATSTESTSTGAGGAVPTEAPATGDDDGSGGSSRTGAIVGGVIGAVTGLALLAGLAFWLLRRRQGNPRQEPGSGPEAAPMTEYQSPRSHGAAFAPLPSWSDERANGSYPGSPDPNNYSTAPTVPPPQPYEPAHLAGIGTGLAPVDEESMRSPSEASAAAAGAGAAAGGIGARDRDRDIDDFSRAYSDARIGQVSSDDDTRPLTESDHEQPFGHSHAGADSGAEEDSGAPPGPIRGGNRPLWQQNRQRSRNLMWM